MSEPGIKGAAGGRSSLRPPDAAVGPAHAPVHLRGARRDPHHRPAADRASARRGAAVRRRGGEQGRGHPLRRHQEAGTRRDQGVGRALRHAVRQPALARRAVDQLPHDVGPDRAPARADRPAGGGPARPAAHQGADGARGRAREARVQPRRRARDEAPAPGRADHRPEDRDDRGARGRAAANPDHRPGGLERRPGADRLPGSRKRRLDPLLRTGHPDDRRGRLRGGAVLAPGRGQAPGRGGRPPPSRGGGAPARRGRGACPPGGRGGGGRRRAAAEGGGRGPDAGGGAEPGAARRR